MYKKILVIIVLIILLLINGCALQSIDLAEYEYKPKEKTVIYSDDNILIAEIYNENRSYVSLENIPDNLVNGIIAVEDSRFYQHKGYDPIGMLRALWSDIKQGELAEGASTLTQQLVRNLFDEISTEKKVNRKLKEIATAVEFEKKYSKDQILEMYLNEIYLGAGTYGVQEASKQYFGKNVWELSLAECALLAGLPQAPSAYQPDKSFEKAKLRQEKVLNRMFDEGYITEEQAESAKSEELIIVEGNNKGFVGRFKEGYESYINQVINEYMKYYMGLSPGTENANKLAMESLKNDGLIIHTTINSKIQDQGLSSLNKVLNKYNMKDKEATGSFVTIDSSKGSILAYYGGNTDIDMANEKRQPGSAIKPLIYSCAIENGLLNRNSLIYDELTDFNGYKPKNIGDKYYGYITVREAIVNSLNIPAVKVMEMVGVNKTLKHIQDFGITVDKKDYSLATALGGMTYGASPLEMTKAYGVFANSGVYTEAYFINSIEEQNGKVIYKHEFMEENSHEVITPYVAREIEDILFDVVNRGTGTRARTDYYSGGKTGTTTGGKDMWFCGFTGNITSTIWIGNIESKSLYLSSKYSAEVYGYYINKIISSDVFLNQNIREVSVYNNTEKIMIISPEAELENGEIGKEDVIEIVIPTDEKKYFEDSIVELLILDKETGKLFVEGRCPEKNRQEVYYFIGQEPLEYCDSLHIMDKIEDIFDKDNDKKIGRGFFKKNKD